MAKKTESTKLNMLCGSGRFIPSGCRHQDCGYFLYFDDLEYSYIFECEDDPVNHDFNLSGRWGDGSPFGGMKNKVFKLLEEQSKEV